jgi:hypothetical protein
MKNIFRRKPKTERMPMSQRKRNIIGAIIGVLGFTGTMVFVAPAAQAGTASACYIMGAGPDHHAPFRHGEVYASVDFTWIEEHLFREKDGYRFFGITSWDRVDTRPYWINGC